MSVKKQVSIHGTRAFITKDDQFVSKNGFVAGGADKPAVVLPGNPNTVAIFDDFIGGDTGHNAALRANTNGYWRVADGDTGNDTGTDAKIVSGTNGIMRFTISSTNSHTGPATGNAFGVAMASNLAWKGNQGSVPTETKNGLRFACRLKASGYTDTGRQLNIFAGFTDAFAFEAAPVYDTGGAVQATATDAVGFWYSGGADTGWSALSVNAGGTPQSVALDATRQAIRAPGGTDNSNVYDTLEMEIHHGPGDQNGVATFYVNGLPKGAIEAPIAMNVALAPIIHVSGSDTGGGMVVDVDWVNVSAPRDTGV